MDNLMILLMISAEAEKVLVMDSEHTKRPDLSEIQELFLIYPLSLVFHLEVPVRLKLQTLISLELITFVEI